MQRYLKINVREIQICLNIKSDSKTITTESQFTKSFDRKSRGGWGKPGSPEEQSGWNHGQGLQETTGSKEPVSLAHSYQRLLFLREACILALSEMPTAHGHHLTIPFTRVATSTLWLNGSSTRTWCWHWSARQAESAPPAHPCPQGSERAS